MSGDRTIGESADYVLEMNNQTYKMGIASVRLHLEGNVISHPFRDLHGDAPFVVSFDDLNGGFSDYYYTLIHCNPWWERSDLDAAEYIRGFEENYISDYDQSFNTLIDYTHYTFSFPNEMCEITKSGNYVLFVYENGNRDEPVFTQRFVIYEQLVSVVSNVHESSMVSERRYLQEVDFSVIHPAFAIQNPYEDLEVVVLQNNRWDNAIMDLEPRFVKDKELDYNYGERLNFMGGNEFRSLDMKNLKYLSMRVDSTRILKDGWHVWVTPEALRTFTLYRTDPDINGKYLPYNDTGIDTDLEADYAFVHFNMPFDLALSDADFYLFGAFAGWRMQEENRFQYNPDNRSYELTRLMKQGYYNYAIAARKKGSSIADLSVIEGNHSETENEYQIVVYNFDLANDYYRVIGVHFTNSFNNQ
ncbi:MAG: DUF5103 domain-containing protein [Flavobacteriales bacterium]|nr:DUF5103 domain-containing protein [Flavobacteriales bacterium]